MPLRARDFLLTSIFLLLALSTVMVFSASAFRWSVESDTHFFLRRQLLWMPIAVLVCALFSQLDYRLYRRYYGHILLLTIVLLALVLVPQIGHKVNNSRRWLPFGGLQFQPSELAKLAVILFVAGLLTTDPTRCKRFVGGFLVAFGGILCVFALILLEPDLGTSVFVLGLSVLMLVLAGMRFLYLFASFLMVGPVLALFVYLRWDMVQARLKGVLEPETVHQVKQSLMALGSGGYAGVGLGAGSQKLRYLPEAHTDFIMAVIGEELGLLGCAAVIGIFLMLIWSGGVIAWRARDSFGFLVAAGITTALGFQAAFNIAVVTASAPTKGIAFPLLSFGGSGLCMTMAEVGILLSVARLGDERAQELSPAGGRRTRRWRPAAGLVPVRRWRRAAAPWAKKLFQHSLRGQQAHKGVES